MQVQGLAALLDDLMGGLSLIGLSTVIGSLTWGAFVLKAGAAGRPLLGRCLRLLRMGAIALAATQSIKIIAKAGVIGA